MIGIFVLIIVCVFIYMMECKDTETRKDTPFKCPVCDGKGIVDYNFYEDANMNKFGTNETCRTCEGDTIIWESEYE